MDCVAGSGACVALHCKHMVFMADTSLFCSAFLRPAPYPDCCHYQRDITQKQTDLTSSGAYMRAVICLFYCYSMLGKVRPVDHLRDCERI